MKDKSQSVEPVSEKLLSRQTSLDRVGTFASSACVVHCAICAVAPGILAALGISWFAGHKTEWAFTIIAVVIALAAILSAWRSHRSHMALTFLSVGAIGLLLSRSVEEGGSHALGTAIGIVSGLALLSGHLSNIRMTRARNSCCDSV